MKRNLFAAFILSCALASVGSAQQAASPGANGPQYTKAQLKQLVQDAHTPDQYKALAGYYRGRRESYLQQAAEEKLEWDRRSQNTMSIAAKYPRPVDSARNLYEYYMSMASESNSLASKYDQLSGR